MTLLIGQREKLQKGLARSPHAMAVNAVLELSTEHVPGPPFMLELMTGLHHEKLTSAQWIKNFVY